MVYEPQQRNSGISGGKFLEKGKYKNVETGNNFFNPTDFVVGQDCKINGFSFKLLDLDEFTRKWFEANMPEQLTKFKVLSPTKFDTTHWENTFND